MPEWSTLGKPRLVETGWLAEAHTAVQKPDNYFTERSKLSNLKAYASNVINQFGE